jgi:plastocyanin
MSAPPPTNARLRKVPTVALALIVPFVAIVALLITLNATSDGGGGGVASGGGTAVSIENFQYSPDPIVVKAGSTLSVTNDDGTRHTLTADDATFDTGDLDGGAEATITIGAPGTYAYHCDIHNYMTGTIEAR